MNETITTPTPQDWAVLLPELREAYSAALTNEDDKLEAWCLKVDEHAELLFDYIDELKTGLANSAAVILAGDKERREINEQLASEILRNKNQLVNHNKHVQEMNAEIAELKEQVEYVRAQLKLETDRFVEIAEELKRKHSDAALRSLALIKEHKIPITEIAHFIARVT